MLSGLTLHDLPVLLKQLTGLPGLIWYLARLPRADVPLSEGPAGRLIAEHLSCRRWGLPRFRLAQGVLYLPADFSAYLRGKRRQALRTNLKRGREQGLRWGHTTIPDWTPLEPSGDPGYRGLTQAATSEHWWVLDRDGLRVCEAWLTVDDKCALLHRMASSERNVRWLLHTAIVERLCASSCQMLLTNSHDAPLMSPGQQHFQHLLGYSIARLRPSTARPVADMRRRVHLAALAIIAVTAIVSSQALTIPFRPAGHRALVWLTALVAIRLAANRTGLATLIGGIAGLAIALLGVASTLAVPLVYPLCGVALDIELALFPRLLARSAAAMSLAGAAVMFVTLIAPAFPTLGHHPAHAPWAIPPVIGAIAFGALASWLGYRLGRALRRGMLPAAKTA